MQLCTVYTLLLHLKYVFYRRPSDSCAANFIWFLIQQAVIHQFIALNLFHTNCHVTLRCALEYCILFSVINDDFKLLATVLAPQNTVLQVFFVDYGNTSIISVDDQIKECPARIAKIPYFVSFSSGIAHYKLKSH